MHILNSWTSQFDWLHQLTQIDTYTSIGLIYCRHFTAIESGWSHCIIPPVQSHYTSVSISVEIFTILLFSNFGPIWIAPLSYLFTTTTFSQISPAAQCPTFITLTNFSDWYYTISCKFSWLSFKSLFNGEACIEENINVGYSDPRLKIAIVPTFLCTLECTTLHGYHTYNSVVRSSICVVTVW